MKNIFLFIFFLISLAAGAQENVEMADKFYSEGKIYVVIAILSVIFAGLIVYLVLLDRKITRMEKEIRK